MDLRGSLDAALTGTVLYRPGELAPLPPGSGGQAVVDTAMEAFGRVDVVISNAGILRDKAFHNMTPELLDPVLDVHLKGAFHVLRPAWVKMREAGYGRVLVTASNAGILGNFGQSNYGAAKMGLVGLARVLAHEGARYNIKVKANAEAIALIDSGQFDVNMQTDEGYSLLHYAADAGNLASRWLNRILRR